MLPLLSRWRLKFLLVLSSLFHSKAHFTVELLAALDDDLEGTVAAEVPNLNARLRALLPTFAVRPGDDPSSTLASLRSYAGDELGLEMPVEDLLSQVIGQIRHVD